MEMEQKRAILLTIVGSATYQLFKSLVQAKNPKEKTYHELKELLETYYHPKPSAIVQRFRFYSRVRQLGESFSTYVVALRATVEHYDFKDTLDLMIRNHLVCGINNARFQRRLLQEETLTYADAFMIAQAVEVAAKDHQDLSQQDNILRDLWM